MRRILSILAVLPFAAAPAFGWGCEGHQMIALIARAYLTPAASNAVDQLLRGSPIDPALNRFCKDRPNDLMADSATWADDAKNSEKTADWHFIDIPLAIPSANPRADVMQWCKPTADGKPGCIVTAIDYEWALLRDKSQPSAARAKALRYLIHLVGDLAQPLHASDNHDRGGNCTEIRFLSQEKPENLHAIWDYKILARALDMEKATEPQYAKTLTSASGYDSSARVDVVGWTWESHALASTVAYPNLKPAIPVARADAGLADQAACNVEKDLVRGLHVSIGEDYVNRALPVIREQLTKAGYHLAGLLNQTFQ